MARLARCASVPRVKYSALVLLLVVSACGGGGPGDQHLNVVFDACEPLTLLVPSNATAGERGSFADAVAMWNARGTTRLTLEESEDGQRLPFELVRDVIFFGQYDDEAGKILLNRDLDDRSERAVTIAHEVGHAMGLWHVAESERRSVMNKGNRVVEPTAGDDAALHDTWGNCTALP